MKAPPCDDVSYFLNHWQLNASAGNDVLKNISVSLVITGELILALMMMMMTMMNAEIYVTMKKRNARPLDEQSLRHVDVNEWKVVVSVQLKHF